MKKRIISFLVALACALSFGLSLLAAETLVWPVPGHTSRSRNFISGSHFGIDISDGGIEGSTVVAAKSGTVSLKFTCSHNTYPASEDCCYGFGTGLVIRGDDGNYYQYAHMKANSIPSDVYCGSYVTAGQTIGKVGNTGNSTGAHLHFQISDSSSDWWASYAAKDPDSFSYGTAPQSHIPKGHLDSVSGGTGTVTVAGWASDGDDMNQSIKVHVYIGGNSGNPNAECHEIIANKYRPDYNSQYTYHGFEATIQTKLTGSQEVHVYAINIGEGSENPEFGSGKVTIKSSCSHSYSTSWKNDSSNHWRVCSSCGEKSSVAKHSYKNTVVDPTTSSKGYTSHKCTVCGYTYKDTYTDALVAGSDGWTIATTLPSNVTSDKYTIQYNNKYEKVQTSSPGSGWTQGTKVKDEWQNSGSQYTSYSELSTSDSRVLVKAVYYHFCGPNAGDEAEYYQTGNFVHYDEVPMSAAYETNSWPYEGRYVYYINWNNGGQIACKSGSTCDGSYGEHSFRCRAWFKMWYYQDRVHVLQYKWTKESGWVSAKDSSATSVQIRYKAKTTATPTNKPTVTATPTPVKNSVGDVTLSSSSFTYNGKVQKPSVTVKDSNGNVISSSNYTVSYSSGCTNVGKYTVTVTMKGNYSGTKTATYIIKPAKTSISSLSSRSKGFYVKWSKVSKQISGYQIQYSTSSTFTSGNKTVNVSWKSVSKTISKLKGKKKYYVRIRVYKTVNGVKYYSDWSNVKSVTTKK